MPPIVEDKPKRYVVKVGDQVIGKAELRRIPVSQIKIDVNYQRDVSNPWVAQHLPFNPHEAGAIVLSGRAGGPYCIDGGHRLALARQSGELTINAFIIEGLTQKDEARLFTRYQRNRRDLTSYALFRADLVAGDEDTIAMVRVVNNAGFRLEKTAGSPTTITAIDSCRYIQRYGGEDLLARTLALVKSLWVGEDKALSGPVLKGVALFLQSEGKKPYFQLGRLEKVMQRHGPSKVLRLSQAIAQKRNSIHAGPANIAEALVEEYNKSLPHGEQPIGPLTLGRSGTTSKRRPAAYRTTP
jgi:hypothetical protein